MNANIPMLASIDEPPFDISGRVTPVRGKRSVEPKMLSAAWKRNIPAAAAAAIE